jgi:hypothetical protein
MNLAMRLKNLWEILLINLKNIYNSSKINKMKKNKIISLNLNRYLKIVLVTLASHSLKQEMIRINIIYNKINSINVIING